MATLLAGPCSGRVVPMADTDSASEDESAGTFEDCWRRKQQGYDVWQVYCHGVGMVVSHYAAWGGDSRAELVAFSG